MLVSGGENATITRRMFNSLRDQLDPTIAAISTCLIVVSVGMLVGVQLDRAEKGRAEMMRSLSFAKLASGSGGRHQAPQRDSLRPPFR